MNKIRIMVILFLAVFNLRSSAQSCSGVLGDKILNIDFGAGAARGPALLPEESDYTYTDTYGMLAGQYSIVNTTGGYYSQWFTIPDHTGNTNGYMMAMNCAAAGDKIYSKKVSGLCPNTTYEYAAWVINLVNSATLQGVNVNLTLSVETTDGTIIKRYNTGDITESSTPEWKQFSTFFTTPVNTTDVILRIINNNPGGDGNDLALDDITLRPCLPMIVASFNQANPTTATNLCQGDDAAYTLNTNITGAYGNPVYQWQVNANNGTGWVDIPGKTTTSTTILFQAAKTGFYQYRLATVKAENRNLSCSYVFSDTLTVQVNAKPVPAASGNTPICEGSTLHLHVLNGASYQWTGPGGFTSSLQNPSIPNITTSKAGKYRVVLTSAQGCMATDSIIVAINPQTTYSAGSDVTICKGGSTMLNASGGSFYRWKPSQGLSDTTIANPVASPAVTMAYQVLITNRYGCIYTDTVMVTVAKPLVADAGPDKKTVAGKSTRLNGKITGGQFTYYWSPTTYLSDATTLTPLVTTKENITYTLHAVSQNGCSGSVDSVTVDVSSDLAVPNTFSPNGDGVNDSWNIPALEAYPGSMTEVFNRYGSEIFRSIGQAKLWDGTINGQPVPVGTYYYKITGSNGNMLKAGWVFLVR